MDNYKVYIIKNDINDKVYVGSTINTLEYRFRGHCSQRAGELDNDIKKFGKEHFWIELLQDNIHDFETLDKVENEYIKKYNAIDNGYNDRLTQMRQSRQKNTRYQDLTGMKFGRLTVLGELNRGNDGINWLCKCDCGNMHVASGRKLRKEKGGVKSCGCATIEAGIKSCKSRAKHNYSKERLYIVWKNMRRRCNNPNDSAYMHYGERGITVCSEWNDYLTFRKWAYNNGYDENAPRGKCTLDRIDNDGPYAPWNCRWADNSVQGLNQQDTVQITYNGKTMTICQWAKYLGVNKSTLIQRRLRGWDYAKMLSTPIRKTTHTSK